MLELFHGHRVRLLVPGREGFDQPPLDGRRSAGCLPRKPDMVEAALCCLLRLGRPVFPPGQVVKGARRIGDAPMGHRAARIEAEHLFKTSDGFFVVEAVTPVEADIEPSLRLWRPCGYSSAVSAEINPLHGLPICDSGSCRHVTLSWFSLTGPNLKRSDEQLKAASQGCPGERPAREMCSWSAGCLVRAWASAGLSRDPPPGPTAVIAGSGQFACRRANGDGARQGFWRRAAVVACCYRPLAAWYCSTTLAGMRPRSLTARPCSFAQARISPERCRPAAVRPGRRDGARPARRACSR